MISSSAATHNGTPPISRRVARSRTGNELHLGKIPGGLSEQEIEIDGRDRRALKGCGGVADEHGLEVRFVQPARTLGKQRLCVHAESTPRVEPSVLWRRSGLDERDANARLAEHDCVAGLEAQAT